MVNVLGTQIWPTVKARFPKFFAKYVKPASTTYQNLAGYRQVGLRYDDLIPEDNETVLKALSRLPPIEIYDRNFRHRVALQLSMAHQQLPESQWTTDEQDIKYLTPLIEEIVAEEKEREYFDSLEVLPKKK